MQAPEMPSKRTRAPSDKESAATRFLDEFGGKPDEFYAFLGAERYEGKLSNEISVLLNQELRYAKGTGWVYSVNAYNSHYGNAGTFTVSAATTKEYLQQVFDAVIKLYDRIRQHGLNLEEIEFAKNKLIKRTMGRYETASSWVENHFYQTLAAIHPHPHRTKLSLQYPLYDFIHRIATVTPEDTQRIAEKYFQSGELRLAICGNITPNDFKIDF